jgi:alkaline phosphatase D
MVCLLFFHGITLLAQVSLLQSGPMVGYSEMLEVPLWVQTKQAAKVQFEYWEEEAPMRKFRTEARQTDKNSAFTATLPADQVQPGKRYAYQLIINDQLVKLDYPARFQTQTLWQWRSDPPNFRLAAGSCAYVNDEPHDRPGTPYGGEYHIFETIRGFQPDAMLWLGDNVYLREPDWNSRTGILYRYTHTRSLPELQPLLASTHHYAIWDDHDFGPDDSDGSFVHKDKTLEAFRLFWPNPSYGLDGKPGTTTAFQFSDIDFFLLDNRYYRSANFRRRGNKQMLGIAQIEWLIDALVKSQAPFKMIAIGGQVLNTAPVNENYIHHFAEEREYLLRRIEEENITGVIFLTGDRHHSELSRYVNNRGHVVYDLTCSPLTSGVARNPETNNTWRVEGTLLAERNFVLLDFEGPREARTLSIRAINADGRERWRRVIEAGK